MSLLSPVAEGGLAEAFASLLCTNTKKKRKVNRDTLKTLTIDETSA